MNDENGGIQLFVEKMKDKDMIEISYLTPNIYVDGRKIPMEKNPPNVTLDGSSMVISKSEPLRIRLAKFKKEFTVNQFTETAENQFNIMGGSHTFYSGIDIVYIRIPEHVDVEGTTVKMVKK